MGPRVDVSLERHGFYPAGGGRWFATITPAQTLTPITLDTRGQTVRREARAICAGLPGEIGVRELQRVHKRLNWSGDDLRMRQPPADQGPGNAILLMLFSEHATEVVCGFGQRGVTAETVADGAIDQMRDYLRADVPVGEHLADQLLLPFALAGGGSFVTRSLSPHARTNMDIIQRFLPVAFDTHASPAADRVTVRVRPT
jgi:RNA 3'-terminal phosphate cyclase (ATP)